MIFWRSLFSCLIALALTIGLAVAVIVGKASAWWFVPLFFVDLVIVNVINKPHDDSLKYVRMPLANERNRYHGNVGN